MTRDDINKDDAWFTGERKILSYAITNAATGVPLNCSGLLFSWMLKENENDLDADALLTKDSSDGISVTGTYNTDAAVNTQRVEVTINPGDTRALTGILNNASGRYWHELKRIDTETILSKGEVLLQQALHVDAPA